MKMLIYKLLTLAIIKLGGLRERVGNSIGWELRKDRDEHNLMPKIFFSKAYGILLGCCDCGLYHRLFESDKGSHGWPERPKGYDYKMRAGQ